MADAAAREITNVRYGRPAFLKVVASFPDICSAGMFIVSSEPEIDEGVVVGRHYGGYGQDQHRKQEDVLQRGARP